MHWKLTRGKWRPRLWDFISSLDDVVVKTTSQKAFQSLPDISKAVSELSALKGIGAATASIVLAAFAPHLTPFMSDEELSSEEVSFTPSDVEGALWSCAVGKSSAPQLNQDPKAKTNPSRSSKRKRKN